MSKKTKSSPILIFLVVLFTLCIISILIDYWYISLPVALVGVGVAIYFIQKRKNAKEQNNIVSNVVPDVVPNVNNIANRPRIISVDMLKGKIEDNVLKYKYDEKMYYTSDITPDESFVGKDIDFVAEPENEYDSKAIAIYVDGNKLGYVYKGMVQDMLHDWFKKDYTYTACISYVAELTVRFIIGFYKPIESLKCEVFKLTKTSKRIDEFSKRSEYAELLTEGESVSFEWDDESEDYIVYDDCYNEIGELPKKANAFLEDIDNYAAVVDESDTSDGIIVKIAIYY